LADAPSSRKANTREINEVLLDQLLAARERERSGSTTQPDYFTFSERDQAMYASSVNRVLRLQNPISVHSGALSLSSATTAKPSEQVAEKTTEYVVTSRGFHPRSFNP
jgi:hypothetical protein